MCVCVRITQATLFDLLGITGDITLGNTYQDFDTYCQGNSFYISLYGDDLPAEADCMEGERCKEAQIYRRQDGSTFISLKEDK